MILYRIACTFEPKHRRLNGRTTRKKLSGRLTKDRKPHVIGHRMQRGAWRVVRCWALDNAVIAGCPPVETEVAWLAADAPRSLIVFSTYPAAAGTLCNPRDMLDRWLDLRRLARAVNRVGHQQVAEARRADGWLTREQVRQMEAWA